MTKEPAIILNDVILDFPVSKSGPAFLKEFFTGRMGKRNKDSFYRAVNKISLDIKQGEVFGIIGPNGAGKSTLIKTLLGLIQLTSGEGKVLGYDIRTQGDSIRQRIGYMPEYDCLNPDMEAVHQVRYAGELLGMHPTSATQRAHETMEYVGLLDQRYRTVGTFSTGMEQATKLACALVHDPDLLICDEPTNG
ncbi:MAG: ABC transporter ATP-binding protein, partial [Candidatus Thalassarchaeaceae archaeon]|nr:ABC transporter ATP-binding protein [Candidatus Thalassarchaeaceae archaeon]